MGEGARRRRGLREAPVAMVRRGGPPVAVIVEGDEDRGYTPTRAPAGDAMAVVNEE